MTRIDCSECSTPCRVKSPSERRIAYRIGGRIETDAAGKVVFVIPVKETVPSKLEKSWAPGPIANSKFSTEEMSRINEKPEITVKQGLKKIAPGWKITNCGNALEPGLRNHLQSKDNVFVSHPGLDKTDCVLSKVITIPAGKQTQLKLTVGHHPNGDWQLIVKADGNELLKKLIGKDTVNDDGWMDVEVELSEFAGKDIKLELINHANDWNHESAYWAQIKITTN